MRILALLVIAAAAGGCGSARVYLNADVASALVLAPLNETNDSQAPWTMWKYVEDEVAARGYRLVPHDTVVAWYTAKQYTGDPGQVAGEWTTEELAKEFKVDAVVWSKLISWDKKTLGVYNAVEVKIAAEVHDRAANVLWKGEGQDGYSQTAKGKGILSSLVGTVAADLEDYAPGAASACFAGLPWAGWDPEAPRTPAPVK